MNTSLILVDIQNDYFPGGKMELVGSLEAGDQARKLLEYFRRRDLPRLHIQHLSIRPGASFFIPGSEGVNIHKLVQPIENEVVYQKNYPNSFRSTPLLEHLQNSGVQRLVICGMMTHMCIDATTRAAYDYGFDCVVVQDACATRNLTFQDQVIPAQHVHYSFLAALKSTYARVLNAGDIATEEFWA